MTSIEGFFFLIKYLNEIKSCKDLKSVFHWVRFVRIFEIFWPLRRSVGFECLDITVSVNNVVLVNFLQCIWVDNVLRCVSVFFSLQFCTCKFCFNRNFQYNYWKRRYFQLWKLYAYNHILGRTCRECRDSRNYQMNGLNSHSFFFTEFSVYLYFMVVVLCFLCLESSTAIWSAVAAQQEVRSALNNANDLPLSVFTPVFLTDRVFFIQCNSKKNWLQCN